MYIYMLVLLTLITTANNTLSMTYSTSLFTLSLVLVLVPEIS